MIILTIETSTDACSAAICDSGRPLFRRLTASHSEHSKELPQMVAGLMEELSSQGKKLDAIGVSSGPGSYTGLRIGASLAKGLAYSLDIPLLAVPTLQIMSAAALSAGAEGLLCPMIDARRMEVYDALYSSDLSEQRAAQATVVDSESFADVLSAGVVCFFGNGSDKCKCVLTHPNARFIEGIVPDAAYMGELAEGLLREGKTVDVAYWTPFYLKEFEAKVSVVKGLH